MSEKDDKQVRFIKEFTIGKSTKELYYQNIEKLQRSYFTMILIGLVMLFYVVIY